ncbi:MAG: hypothetical protein K9I70_10930 [Chitinophagaceae bacterium]|nr:hypothetical protein [Chitinophagaceae bacterium]
MRRKINLFTLLIFVYSIVICLTCNRDFSAVISKPSSTEGRFLLVNNQVIPISTKQRITVHRLTTNEKNEEDLNAAN